MMNAWPKINIELTNLCCIVLLFIYSQAEEILYQKGLDHEYGPISGDPDYCDAVAKLAFGEDSPVLKNKSNCTIQVILYYYTYRHVFSLQIYTLNSCY